MLVIVSNTGCWDHDMWGTVGTISSIAYPAVVSDFHAFVKNDKRNSEGFSEDKMSYVEGEDKCLKSFEENEVNFLCKGTTLSYIQVEEDGCFPSIYYLVELN